jgi:ABC-2 type transport system permease protein
MLDAISAETLKLTRHKASWFLVWLYPAGLALIFLLVILAGVFGGFRPQPESLDAWIRDTAIIWMLPNNTVGRFLIAAFVSVAFAGEYGWNTWKLIIPHRSRSELIASKYIVVIALLVTSFILSAAITTIGSFVEDAASGVDVPSGVTAGLILEAQGKGAIAAIAPFLLTIGYASLAAILTRSTLAALVISIVAVSVEQLLYGLAPLLYFKAPGLVLLLYHVLPGYHLANLGHWIGNGSGLATQFPAGPTVALGWLVSLAVLAAWVAGLAALTIVSFRRQDIN